MAGADSGTQRTCGGALAGFARGGFAGNVAGRTFARDTAFAFGWTAVWGSGRGGGSGARNLVGAAAGVVQQDARGDGGAEELVSLDRDASELCRGELSGSRSREASLTLETRNELDARYTNRA